MRAIIQRVKKANVKVNEEIKGQIGVGALIFLGVEEEDNEEDIDWLANKVSNLRIFDDNAGKMNLSIRDADGEFLVISQFTLHAQVKKGNRPSFIKSAAPETSKPLYEKFVEALKNKTNKTPETGEFGAMMDVELINDGPVTIFIDTKKKM